MLDVDNTTSETTTEVLGLLDVPVTLATPLREKVATPSTWSAVPPVLEANTAGPVPLVVAERAGEALDVLSMDAATALPVPTVSACKAADGFDGLLSAAETPMPVPYGPPNGENNTSFPSTPIPAPVPTTPM